MFDEEIGEDEFTGKWDGVQGLIRVAEVSSFLQECVLTERRFFRAFDQCRVDHS